MLTTLVSFPDCRQAWFTVDSDTKLKKKNCEKRLAKIIFVRNIVIIMIIVIYFGNTTHFTQQ